MWARRLAPAGAAYVHHHASAQCPSKKKGPRLSLIYVGVFWLELIRTTAYLGLEYVRSYLPEPRMRYFEWLLPTEGPPMLESAASPVR